MKPLILLILVAGSPVQSSDSCTNFTVDYIDVKNIKPLYWNQVQGYYYIRILQNLPFYLTYKRRFNHMTYYLDWNDVEYFENTGNNQIVPTRYSEESKLQNMDIFLVQSDYENYFLLYGCSEDNKGMITEAFLIGIIEGLDEVRSTPIKDNVSTFLKNKFSIEMNADQDAPIYYYTECEKFMYLRKFFEEDPNAEVPSKLSIENPDDNFYISFLLIFLFIHILSVTILINLDAFMNNSKLT